MRKLSIDKIKGTEILAKDIYGNTHNILMSKGIQVKKEYVSRLRQLNIDYIYVNDQLSEGVKEEGIIEKQVKQHCQETIKNTLDKYSYCGNVELEILREVAEEIIFDLLDQPEIMFNITGVRQKSENAFVHSLNVCTLAIFIALKMKINKKIVSDIAIGSILHDIGLNFLTFDYNNIKFENYTEKQLKEYKKHVVYGYSAVEHELWLSPVAKDIILSHHERIDGSGYPFHLKGNKTKIGSKVVAICDEFDQLVSGNFGEQPMKVHQAIEYIISMSEIKFDYNIVKKFYECVAAYPNGSTVLTNSNEIGIVIRQNVKCPTRPVLRMIENEERQPYEDWVEKDLTKELTLFIQDVIEII